MKLSIFTLALTLSLTTLSLTTTNARGEPISNADKTAAIKDSWMNPPWQMTNPHNMNPLGLPPEMAGQEGKLLRGGAYPSGRSIASEKYGLIDNPQNAHAIGPNFGNGGVNPPTDRPRFYPKDFLTDAEPSVVTPPTSFKATNPLFNPNNDIGFTPGELEPVHPVPCSTFESDGSGLCNEEPKATKSVADDIMKNGPEPLVPKKELGAHNPTAAAGGALGENSVSDNNGYDVTSPEEEKRAEANSGAQQRVNTVNNFFFNQVKRATQLLQ